MRERFEISEEMEPSNLTRRQVVFGGFSLMLLAAAGLSCKKERPKKPRGQLHPAPIMGNEWLEDFSVQVPHFEISDRPYVFPKPPNLHMSEAEFQEICRRIGYAAGQVARNGVTPALRANPQDLEKIAMAYLADTAGFITAAHPEIAADMQAFHAKWDRSGRHTIPFITKLNQYLNPGGYFLDFQPFGAVGEGKVRLNVFPIRRTFTIRPRADRDTSEIPILELGDGVIPLPFGGGREGAIASCDSEFEHVIVFSREVDASLTGLFSTRPPYERFLKAGGLDALREKFYRSSLSHEATHIMTARRFPHSGRMAEIGQEYEVPFMLRIGGIPVDLSGLYPPVTFQELCGVGAHLALTEIESPLEHGMYIRGASDLPPEYELAGRILPLLTVHTAPESPLKQNLLRGLAGGFLDLSGVIALLGSRPSGPEHTKRAGEMLYRIGYSLLERAERGEFRLVESMP